MTLLRGSAFCISDRRGDFSAQYADGLFVRDARILSDWELRIDNRHVEALTVLTESPAAAVFVARALPESDTADSTLTVVRHRTVCEGMVEKVVIRNYADEPAAIEVALRADADLADLFEVKDGRIRSHVTRRDITADDRIRITRGGHGVLIRADCPAEHAGDGWRWSVEVPPRGRWSVTVSVTPLVDGLPVPTPDDTEPVPDGATRSPADPRVTSPNGALVATLTRSVEDLRMLQVSDPQTPGRLVVAAGAPWYMALFGRDSLLTSWMALPVDPALAIDTLQTLAGYQGRLTDAISEEEPGRIPHEVRFGPSAPLAFGERNAYYGTVDATPLFVALVGELRRWGHDDQRVRSLLPAVDRALHWIDEYGDADGDGYVEYRRQTDQGLANQGWKDSRDGISYADGTLATAPIALAEVQGYSYAAFVARAELARDLGDASAQSRWHARAAALKAAFNRDFWLPESGWFAVGLDADKRPIDALASNPGHCLWTGIVDDDKAAVLAQRLVSHEMSSGWGLRTLATTMGAYNPVSYHNGSVWPHDTAICVAGLMRYGHVEAACRLGVGLLSAADRFDHRLPELFCGFAREDFSRPVPYPTSCSPQAWSAAAPLLVLRALLGFEPDLTTGRIWCAPHLPTSYLPLTMRGVSLGERRVSLTVGPGGVQVDGLDRDQVTVLDTPRPTS